MHGNISGKKYPNYLDGIGLNKKILIGSIIAVAILLLPSTLAIEQESFNRNDLLPDLVPWGFSFYSEFAGGFPPDYAYFSFKNIGEATAYGDIPINITIIRLLFGRYEIKTTYSTEYSYPNSDGLAPDKFGSWWFHSCKYITPRSGFYQFNSYVNFNESIEESNYSNNFYSVRYLYLFGYYIPL